MNFCYGGPMASNKDTYYLNFEQFFEIIRVFYFFSDYEIPFNNGMLAKKDILR